MGLKAWAVSRVLGRVGLGGFANHLASVQRWSGPQEGHWSRAQPGWTLAALARSARTAAAVQARPYWVWPYWLERQLALREPRCVPVAGRPMLANIGHRDWTTIGNVASPYRAIVDPRGLVTPWPDGWSLDWWVGAEDRWHFPGREPAARQRLLDGCPVVETVVRVPGGEAVHRAYATVNDGVHVLVIEVENRSAAPFAAALALRPYNPEGLAVVNRITLHDRRVVCVDGRPALVLPVAPAFVLGSSFSTGDVAGAVSANETGPEVTEVRCREGLAQAALVFPVAHAARVRVIAPMAAQPPTRRRRVERSRAEAERIVGDLPAALTVARGWTAQAARGIRLVLPQGRLADAVEANRKFLLLAHEGGDLRAGAFSPSSSWFRDACYLSVAMGQYGFHDEVSEVLSTFPRRQKFDGYFSGPHVGWDANGCALRAIAEHWRMTRDRELLGELADPVALGARWIQRQRAVPRRARPATTRANRIPSASGMLAPSSAPYFRGPPPTSYWDNCWGVSGLRDAAEMLAAVGNDYGAQRCRQWARTFRVDVEASLMADVAQWVAHRGPSSAGRGLMPEVIGSLAACEPLRLLPPEHAAVRAIVGLVRDHACLGDAVGAENGQGLGIHQTVQLATVELARSDLKALDRVSWLVGVATPTFTWPEAVNVGADQASGGCAGDGHWGRATAEFLSLVRNLLVREVPNRSTSPNECNVGLALCSMLPPTWMGQGLEVHDAPTHIGRISFALRWHGARPALLWELQPHAGIQGVRLTAPGVDPSWTSTETRGEVLLNERTELTTT